MVQIELGKAYIPESVLREIERAIQAAEFPRGMSVHDGEDCRHGVVADLKRAFSLGQTYWQQADSEYTSHHRKADVTRQKFDELCAKYSAAKGEG